MIHALSKEDLCILRIFNYELYGKQLTDVLTVT